jgi:hydroxyacylglutathione hydrolase
MFFKQVQQHGDNYSYIIADQATGEAAVVDPSYNAGEIIKILKTQNFQLKYVIDTHGHSDHTAGNIELSSLFAPEVAVYKTSKVPCNIRLEDGDTLYVGKIPIKVIYTPGHTPDGICLLVDEDKLLTGDTLFVGECGRTDLGGGDPEALYDSLFNKILKLTDDVKVFPGHDYGKTPSSTIGVEKKTNYTLKPRSPKEFVAFMNQP